MKKNVLCSLVTLFVLIPAGVVYGEDIKLNDGRVLKDAQVVGSGVDFLRISHDEGIARVDAANLPEALQEKWSMDEEQVKQRKEDLARQERDRKEKAASRARELRESLSDAQKVPRYVQPAELFSLLSALGGVDPVEAQYLTLKWNESEARRVGLVDQAQTFQSQLAALEPKIQALFSERDEQNKMFQDMSQKVEQLAKASDDQIKQLQQQIRGLQYDLNDARSRTTNTVIVRPPYYYNNVVWPPYYPSRPSVIIRPTIRPSRPIFKPDNALRPGTLRPNIHRQDRAPVIRPEVVR